MVAERHGGREFATSLCREVTVEDEVERAVRVARVARMRTSRRQRHSREAVDESGLRQQVYRSLPLERAAERIRVEIARQDDARHAPPVLRLNLLRQRPELLHGQLALQAVRLAYLRSGGAVVAFQVYAVAGDQAVRAAVEKRVGEPARRQYLPCPPPVGEAGLDDRHVGDDTALLPSEATVEFPERADAGDGQCPVADPLHEIGADERIAKFLKEEDHMVVRTAAFRQLVPHKVGGVLDRCRFHARRGAVFRASARKPTHVPGARQHVGRNGRRE